MGYAAALVVPPPQARLVGPQPRDVTYYSERMVWPRYGRGL